MVASLPLPCPQAKGLEHTKCQYRKTYTDGSDANSFFVFLIHTGDKGSKKLRVCQTIRHISAILSHIHHRLSQNHAEYPIYLVHSETILIFVASNIYLGKFKERTMTIRLEQPKDYREVENLTREAFWNVYHPGCTEHYVLNQYRTNPDFIPGLDLVMIEDDKIIGHVMFSKAEIILDDGTNFPSWTFGPISIHPDYKRKGYGLKLLLYALEKARTMGIGLLQMEGNIEFYRHAGFDLASKLKIHYHAEPRESEVPYFLAQELIPGYWGNREGTYCPPKGYFVADENPEAFEAYEATFPQKEKLRLPGQLGYEE